MTARLFDWSARPAERTVTVASLRAGKGRPARHAQVTANTAEEAAAAEAAGIEMAVCRAANVAMVRQGSGRMFVTAALGFAEAVTADEMLRTAMQALTDGADAVITARRLSLVEMLASEDIPVMGHLGFVPRKSTWIGQTRGVGRTEDEVKALWMRFRKLEDAGAFAVEAELISAPLLAAITARTGLVTVSLGSGPSGDVIFLFSEDITGDSERIPRHARAWGRVGAMRREMAAERQAALSAFRTEVASGSYPADAELVGGVSDELLMSWLEGS
jgi:3-methyl-2-oxobutanoate hydroxymethyltransferase